MRWPGDRPVSRGTERCAARHPRHRPRPAPPCEDLRPRSDRPTRPTAGASPLATVAPTHPGMCLSIVDALAAMCGDGAPRASMAATVRRRVGDDPSRHRGVADSVLGDRQSPRSTWLQPDPFVRPVRWDRGGVCGACGDRAHEGSMGCPAHRHGRRCAGPSVPGWGASVQRLPPGRAPSSPQSAQPPLTAPAMLRRA